MGDDYESGGCCCKRKAKVTKSVEDSPTVINNPEVPYSGFIPGGVFFGRKITFRGKVNPCPTSITITLKEGDTPACDIPLQLTFKFPEDKIIRNSRIKTSWGTPMENGPIELYPDQDFQITIEMVLHRAQSIHHMESQATLVDAHLNHNYGAYMIYINGKKISDDFVFEKSDLHKINYLTVEGDLTLSAIQYDINSCNFKFSTCFAFAVVPFAFGIIMILAMGFFLNINRDLPFSTKTRESIANNSATEDPLLLLKDNITITDV